jgi:Cu+-exporting ATPase
LPPYWIPPIQDVDPVCGARVDTSNGVFRMEYSGRFYRFCSARCMEDFMADPAKYTGRHGS